MFEKLLGNGLVNSVSHITTACDLFEFHLKRTDKDSLSAVIYWIIFTAFMFVFKAFVIAVCPRAIELYIHIQVIYTGRYAQGVIVVCDVIGARSTFLRVMVVQVAIYRRRP
ncbi:MAG: hypothetical protein PHZ02_04305 [Desulfocapsaceae bacterium]|nr:hypothetical protein [Desulfocapsaceae bacterium]